MKITFYLQYLDVRFRPLARNINIVAFTINSFLYLPVILYIPSLAFAERKFEYEIITYHFVLIFLYGVHGVQ